MERLNNTVFEDPITTALPPNAKLMQLLFGKQITYSIAAVARLGVADHMSATPVAIDLLAEKVGAQTPSLYRVMRMLSSVGVFRQTERQFSLTPVGELLRSDHKYPRLQGVVYDLPEVLATAPSSQFTGCEDRIHLEAGSFFARAPDGCDAYVLKHILHNWSDDDCIRILTLLREQLPAHGRVLICEMVIRGDPAPTPAKMLDIEMLLLTVGGKERSSEEFRDVLASAGLRIARIVPTPSPLCVVEAFAN